MKCKIEYTDDRYLNKLGIHTQEEFETFCKDAVLSKLFESQFDSNKPHNQQINADRAEKSSKNYNNWDTPVLDDLRKIVMS